MPNLMKYLGVKFHIFNLIRPFKIWAFPFKARCLRIKNIDCQQGLSEYTCVLYDILVTVKTAPYECVIRLGQPKT